MKPEQILGRKEDVKAALKALGIKEGDNPKQPEPFFHPREIIEVAVDGGAKKTQEDWIKYFNSREEVMLSMPDLYHAGKSKDKKLLKALQKDFEDGWEITSTKLIYQPESLKAMVIHYFGSTIIEPVYFEAMISDYSEGKLVKEMLDDSLGLSFLQAIFGTEDEKGTILETLEGLSGKNIDKLEVWTPSQETRKIFLERSLVCGDNNSSFHFDCGYSFITNGHSSLVRR